MLTQEILPYIPHFVHMDDTVCLPVTKEDKTMFFDLCIYYSTTTIKKVIAKFSVEMGLFYTQY